MRKTSRILTAATLNALFFAAGIAFALFFGNINNSYAVKQATNVAQHATAREGREALGFLAHHMPNTHFVRAVPDTTAPGLLRLYTGKSLSPVYFDPLRHYLIIGIVANMSVRAPNQQAIAAGTPSSPTHAVMPFPNPFPKNGMPFSREHKGAK
jgi:hypothetical protein